MSTRLPPRSRQGADGKWHKPEGLKEPADADWWRATDGLWYPPEKPPPSTRAPSGRGSWAALAVAVGGGGLIAGAFSPWVTLSLGRPALGLEASNAGTSENEFLWRFHYGDGWPMIVAGMVLLVIGARAIASRPSGSVRLSAIVLSLASVAWLVAAYLNADAVFGDGKDGELAKGLVGFGFAYGYWLSILGAFIALAGALFVRPERGNREPAT